MAVVRQQGSLNRRSRFWQLHAGNCCCAQQRAPSGATFLPVSSRPSKRDGSRGGGGLRRSLREEGAERRRRWRAKPCRKLAASAEMVGLGGRAPNLQKVESRTGGNSTVKPARALTSARTHKCERGHKNSRTCTAHTKLQGHTNRHAHQQASTLKRANTREHPVK